MLTYKEYNLKLARLRNTRKLTRTMKMVSANKFRKAQEAQAQADRYGREFSGVMAGLLSAEAAAGHPFFQARDPMRSLWVLICASDRGLCGGFNNGLCRFVLNWLETEVPRGGARPRLALWGRRAAAFFQDRFPIAKHYTAAGPRPTFEEARGIGQDLMAAFLQGAADEIYVAFNEFESSLRQTPVLHRLLPLAPPSDRASDRGDRIIDPPVSELIWPMLERQVAVRIQAALLHSAAGEHAARMRAMDNATRNADQLIEETQLLRNRARQSTITRELIEIVAGAEALKA